MEKEKVNSHKKETLLTSANYELKGTAFNGERGNLHVTQLANKMYIAVLTAGDFRYKMRGSDS